MKARERFRAASANQKTGSLSRGPPPLDHDLGSLSRGNRVAERAFRPFVFSSATPFSKVPLAIHPPSPGVGPSLQHRRPATSLPSTAACLHLTKRQQPSTIVHLRLTFRRKGNYLAAGVDCSFVDARQLLAKAPHPQFVHHHLSQFGAELSSFVGNLSQSPSRIATGRGTHLRRRRLCSKALSSPLDNASHSPPVNGMRSPFEQC